MSNTSVRQLEREWVASFVRDAVAMMRRHSMVNLSIDYYASSFPMGRSEESADLFISLVREVLPDGVTAHASRGGGDDEFVHLRDRASEI
jgi:hypothetical protein